MKDSFVRRKEGLEIIELGHFGVDCVEGRFKCCLLGTKRWECGEIGGVGRVDLLGEGLRKGREESIFLRVRWDGRWSDIGGLGGKWGFERGGEEVFRRFSSGGLRRWLL